MTPKPKCKTDALAAIHTSSVALQRVGAIDAISMRKFDESCLAAPVQRRGALAAGVSERTWAEGLLVVIAEADPQSPDALDLLRLAAVESRALYPEFNVSSEAWPSNDPTPPRGIYLIVRADGIVVGMGAHRPLDAVISEVRRMYVHPNFRRCGVAQAVLAKLEAHALSQGFTHMRLETGNRQAAAMALYELCGYNQIAPFGTYVDDPTSVCYEKLLV